MEKKDIKMEDLVQYYEAKLTEKDEKLNMLQEDNNHLRSSLVSIEEDFMAHDEIYTKNKIILDKYVEQSHHQEEKCQELQQMINDLMDTIAKTGIDTTELFQQNKRDFEEKQWQQNQDMSEVLEKLDHSDKYKKSQMQKVDVGERDKNDGITSTHHHELMPKIAQNKQRISLHTPESPKSTKLLHRRSLNCGDNLLNSGAAFHNMVEHEKFLDLRRVQLKKVEGPKNTTPLRLPPISRPR